MKARTELEHHVLLDIEDYWHNRRKGWWKDVDGVINVTTLKDLIRDYREAYQLRVEKNMTAEECEEEIVSESVMAEGYVLLDCVTGEYLLDLKLNWTENQGYVFVTREDAETVRDFLVLRADSINDDRDYQILKWKRVVREVETTIIAHED